MGYIPALMIKFTPLSGTILEDTIDYILRNFVHNWEFKLIVALSIVIIGSIIINKEWAFRS